MIDTNANNVASNPDFQLWVLSCSCETKFKTWFDATSFVVSNSRKEEVCEDVDNLSCQENGLAHQTEFLGTAGLRFVTIFANQIP